MTDPPDFLFRMLDYKQHGYKTIVMGVSCISISTTRPVRGHPY